MKNSVRAVLVTGALVTVLLIGLLIWAIGQRAASEDDPKPQPLREDSHVLDDGGPDAVAVVEFLDFECGTCARMLPAVDELRERHRGAITFAVRYFPLEGHANGMAAAVAAEAAAQQGAFEPMYRSLLENQPQWAGRDEDAPEVFRALAEGLGLDLAAYDRAVRDLATAERVRRDRSEGTFLGIDSTPAFFVDGRRVEVRDPRDLDRAIVEAQAR